ncbi:Hypothetical protein NTJ_12353 [Nesidiocoris tenuis]|uniref:DUF5641 domain-containing protein n=1 Tax=Nesidiocoris tenuis TaxID=355587 RepID=A0ABN7B558_9HEMI|nr:Hypothetical protein NTJ_12353 [Nesidiocoris tenuis]
MSTLFAKVEAILNSRPLCPTSSSPEEAEFLSPGHFPIGRPLIAHPQPLLHDTRDNLLTRWQLVQKMSDQLWMRWRLEYLSTLQGRVKWTRKTPNLAEGDLVLLKDDALPLKWPMARVVTVHSGKDGIVRAATVRTPTSTFKRLASKLMPLLPLKQDPFDSSL